MLDPSCPSVSWDLTPFSAFPPCVLVLLPFLLSLPFCSLWSYFRFIQHWGILTCKEGKNVSRLSQLLLWTAAHSPGKPPLHGQTCCPRKTAAPLNSTTATPAREERTGCTCGPNTGYNRLLPIQSISLPGSVRNPLATVTLGKYHAPRTVSPSLKCIKHLLHGDAFLILAHIFSLDPPISLLNKLYNFFNRPQRANPELDKPLNKTLAHHEISQCKKWNNTFIKSKLFW